MEAENKMETAKGETKEVVDPISEHEPSNKDTLTLQVWSRFDGAQISDVYRVCVMPTSPTVVSKENGHGSTFVEVHGIDVVLLRGLKIEEEEQMTSGDSGTSYSSNYEREMSIKRFF